MLPVAFEGFFQLRLGIAQFCLRSFASTLTGNPKAITFPSRCAKNGPIVD
jgi:hypothetical protein